MNANATDLHLAQFEPQCLDSLANDHYWRVVHLRDLLAHLEGFNLDEPTTGGDQDAACAAMLYSALALAREAVEEADRLNVNTNTYGCYLMAMPVEILTGEGLPRADAGWQRVRAAMRLATGAAATVEDMTHALEMVHQLVDVDEAYASDLENLTRLIELRGYVVGWLDMMGRSNPRVTPAKGKAKRVRARAAESIDVRACLTADEIEQAARALGAGLEGYLMSVLSHPAEVRQPAQEAEHAPA